MEEKRDQNYLFSRFLNFAGTMFSLALDESDMVTLYQAEKLLKVSPFVYENATKFLSENNAVNAIFLAINLAIIAYQYIYASWFLYLVTTISGVKKLYKVIFQNPILGLFFYISFYFRIIDDGDMQKFDLIAKEFGFPAYKDFFGRDALLDSMNRICFKLSGEKLGKYGLVVRNILYKILTEKALPILSGTIVEKSPIILYKLLEYILKLFSRKDVEEIKNFAIYIPDRTIETQRDLDEFSEYVTKRRTEIMRDVRKQSRKNKKKRNLILQRVVERKENGDVVCLDMCKPRVKTAMGCYCEGDCGPTLFLGNSSWCYVDPYKCKKGKYLDKYMGKTYDRCNNKKVQTNCYTGYDYKSCKVKE